ncbi:GNAT family N-acetyltransferase [Peribacillus deserti]|uniref:GNAT family N-acetyltransferase n=1 Tax=Peribacillus deserti TaxID=673318 RepID=A0A2N5M6Q8_9BACI|nr:GNAT family N-acetyltransferase [Peribacillus deserti]PLT30054.1 hypothetical protein CUU66_09915 [Peribacillus deserti]
MLENLTASLGAEMKEDGSFNRQVNRFTAAFGDGEEELPVEAGRYRLLWSAVCPWAHRSVIVRSVLGLEDAISLGTASPMRPDLPHVDWEFSLDQEGVDPVLRIRYMSEIYQKTDPEYSGRPTVPVMVDVKDQKAVNNDYFKLTNYLETAWKSLHKKNAPDLYPEHLREEIDALNDIIFHDVNNGVYKCGFARSQEAYEEAYDALFARLDELEERLSQQRFLFGNFITDSDVRLYATLIRFDAAYYSAFKTNRNRIVDFPHIWGYLRDLYQTPGFGDTTDFHAIKVHYHLSNHIATDDQKSKNILPKGPDLSGLTSTHNRELLSGMEEKFLRQRSTEEAVIIRDASDSELPYIREQRVASYQEHAVNIPGGHWTALKQAISSEADVQAGAQRIVAESEGKIIGSVVLFPAKSDAYEGYVEELDYPEIRMLAVAPEARGKGAGALLVSECIKRAKEQGYSSIGLHTGEFMEGAMRLYERLSFERLPQYDFEPAGDGIIVKAYRLTFK